MERPYRFYGLKPLCFHRVFLAPVPVRCSPQTRRIRKSFEKRWIRHRMVLSWKRDFRLSRGSFRKAGCFPAVRILLPARSSLLTEHPAFVQSLSALEALSGYCPRRWSKPGQNIFPLPSASLESAAADVSASPSPFLSLSRYYCYAAREEFMQGKYRGVPLTNGIVLIKL